eukprot:2862989-Lingulodinium_polyedra.AAC.1
MGTLRHRLQCSQLVPPGGWPPPSARAAAGLQRLGATRAGHLELRGMGRVWLRLDQLPAHGTVRWLHGAPGDPVGDAAW